MMQAILTKYLRPGKSRGSRIKAWCARGSITIDYPHHLPRDERFAEAAKALVAKFVEEDFKRGEPIASNPWSRKMISGGLPDDSGEAFVFLT